jgi:hypothetical protein
MPLHISEIGIRLAVGDPAGAAAARVKGGDERRRASDPQERDELVRQCVEEVLSTLRLLEAR